MMNDDRVFHNLQNVFDTDSVTNARKGCNKFASSSFSYVAMA